MKKINWATVLYFLAGLILSYFALVIGLIILLGLTKKDGRTKSNVIALGSGFVIALIFSLVISPYVIQPRVEKYVVQKYPEVKLIKDTLDAKYPNADIGVVVSMNKSYDSSVGASSDNGIRVEYYGDTVIEESQILEIGKTSCTVLKTTGKVYDYLDVTSRAPLFKIIGIPFGHKTSGMTATCETWLRDPAKENSGE